MTRRIAWFIQKLGFAVAVEELRPEQNERPAGAGDNTATLLPSAAVSGDALVSW